MLASILVYFHLISISSLSTLLRHKRELHPPCFIDAVMRFNEWPLIKYQQNRNAFFILYFSIARLVSVRNNKTKDGIVVMLLSEDRSVYSEKRYRYTNASFVLGIFIIVFTLRIELIRFVTNSNSLRYFIGIQNSFDQNRLMFWDTNFLFFDRINSSIYII